VPTVEAYMHSHKSCESCPSEAIELKLLGVPFDLCLEKMQ
jgi:hypothetical protein